MNTILKSDILTNAIILADFWQRIIGALDGTDTKDIKILGNLYLTEGNLYLGDGQLLATAAELNTLHDRTPGINTAGLPLISDTNRALDYLRVNYLRAGQIVPDVADVEKTIGKIYAYNNFV